jgi:hypothetical protein
METDLDSARVRLGGLDAVPGGVPARAAVDLLSDVVQVIALAQGRGNRQRAPATAGRGQRN